MGLNSFVGGYTRPSVGTRDAGECRQEANLEDLQEISTKQVTHLVNLYDGLVVSAAQVKEHTNVASRHPVGNIISYKRKKKFCSASPPHSEIEDERRVIQMLFNQLVCVHVEMAHEEGELVQREERIKAHVSVVSDPIESTSKTTASKQLSRQLQSFIGDEIEVNGDSVDLQSNGVPADAEITSEQGESVEREGRIEVYVSVVSNPIKATSKEYATEQLSGKLQSFVGDERGREGDSVALQSNNMPVDAEMKSEQGESVIEKERIGVLDSVALDSNEETTNVPATEQVSLELQTSIGYKGREEGDSVAPQSIDVFADAEVSSEQVESLIRD
ncbi:hypothetical protein K7X08_011282 [Anisodus acutangulus]|uniref:Uncharacterized protein n=1 Tax=Anisodus acutangulus TaxID=402998 RepID=A0A9Q1LYV6_9SOLA|nr:hypothetical protein K7X08_011282 [Anisodus acutangulus]